MTVRQFLSYALIDYAECAVFDYALNDVVLDSTIDGVLQSDYADMELLTFDVGKTLCVNVDSNL